MEVHFNIWHIRVNAIENSANMNIGTNLLIGFDSHSKTSAGNSIVNGDEAQSPALCTYVDDRDLMDVPVWHGSPETGAFPTAFGSEGADG